MSTPARARNARSLAAEAVFRARLEELGATLLEPEWLGVDARHFVRCAAGHEFALRPSNARSGSGVCRTCSDSGEKAERLRSFRARLEELGATLLEPVWRGALLPHRVRCAAGHECAPRPSDVRLDGGICRVCADRRRSVVTEAAFRARLEELGATLLEPVWLGTNEPHRVRCAAGHECAPHPNSVQQGQGICRTCAGRAWDVFYVVLDGDRRHVKFGITSGDPRPRLADHARAGFGAVVRLLEGLPGTAAPDMERHVLSTLRLAGESPVRGRE
jgi:hypothetical protein